MSADRRELFKVRRVDFSPDEWIAGCVGLTNAERGLYITACSLIYSHGGPITLAHLRASCLEHGNAFRKQLESLERQGKLQRNGEEIVNKRCEKELENARKRSVNGRENVSQRWKNNDITDTTDKTPVILSGNANHQPSTTNKNTPKSPRDRGDLIVGEKRVNPRANGTNPRAQKTNPRANHDPWGHKSMSEAELCRRFNATAVGSEEHEALRPIVAPGTYPPGF